MLRAVLTDCNLMNITALHSTDSSRAILRPALVALLSVLSAFYFFRLLKFLFPPLIYTKDFFQEYILGKSFLDGSFPYAAMKVASIQYGDFFARAATDPVRRLMMDVPTPHPPPVALFFSLLASLEYDQAAFVWFSLELTFLVASVFVLTTSLHQFYNIRTILLLAFLTIAWLPVWTDLALGQLTILILLLLSLCRYSATHEKQVLCGMILACSILLKPIAIPWLLVFVRRRQWITLVSFLVTSSFVYGITIFRMGVSPVLYYFTDVLPITGKLFSQSPFNISLWNVGQRLFPDWSLNYSVSLALVVLVLAITWFCSSSKIDITTSLSVATIASIFISPVSWYFYLSLLLIPLSELYCRARSGDISWKRLSMIAPVAISLALPQVIHPVFPLLIAISSLAVGVFLARTRLDSRFKRQPSPLTASGNPVALSPQPSAHRPATALSPLLRLQQHEAVT
jgi:hypothetical protein